MKRNECKDYLELLSPYLDKELSQDDSQRVEKHISNCRACLMEMERLSEVDKIASMDVFTDPGANFWEKQRSEVMNKLENKSQSAPVNIKPLQTARSIREQHSGSSKWKYVISIGAAAALILFVANEIDMFKTDAPLNPDQNQIAADVSSDTQNTAQPVTRSNTEKRAGTSTNDAEKDNLRSQDTRKQIPEKRGSEPVKESEYDMSGESAQTREPIQNKALPTIISGATVTNPFTAVAGKFSDVIDDYTSRVRTQEVNPSKVVARSASERFNVPTAELPEQARIEYNRYISLKRDLLDTQNRLERKDAWIEFLADVNEKVILELVIDDLYDIYDHLITPKSPSNLKTEALYFMNDFGPVISGLVGKDIYNEKLTYYRSIK